MLLPKARIPPNITALANRFFTMNGPLSVQLFTFAGGDSLLWCSPSYSKPCSFVMISHHTQNFSIVVSFFEICIL